VATSLYNLAWLRQDQGRFPESVRLFRQALAVCEKLHGPDDLRTARVMFHLAWATAHQYSVPDEKRMKDALDLLERVIIVRKKKLGDKDPEVAFAILAKGFVLLGRTETRREALAAIGDACNAFPGPEGNFPLLQVYRKYGEMTLSRYLNKRDEALTLHKELLSVAREALGKYHPLYILLLGDYAGQLLDAKRDTEAVTVFREVLELARNSPVRWHPVSIDARLRFGDYLRDHENYKEAESQYRDALEIAQTITYRDKYNLAQDKLRRFLTERGRGSEASEIKPFQPKD
jgi:tetratricopeptide (TPR) repeat protein